ncbi:reverse transcriptase domain-containing protein, partial [Tanacetum coccineum]
APRPTGGHGIDYGFIGTLDAETRRQRAEEVGYRIRDVWVDPTEVVEEDVIEDTQDRQTQLFHKVDGLVKDRQFHYETAQLLDQEALGQLSAALGQIQALQARGQTHADDPEGAEQYAAKKNLYYYCKGCYCCKSYCCCCGCPPPPMTAVAVEKLIEARVPVALANHETLQNRTNGHGDGSHNSDTGTRGTMESVFYISNCAVENQIKFATCTFLGNALTWWNSHMKTVTQDVAYAMDWKALNKMMTVKYYPMGEIKKMFHEESEEVKKYVGGLPDMIWGNVMSYQPKTMEKAIEFANDQMDQKVLTITERQAEQKRKLEFNARNNQGHQQQNKRQNTRRAYTAGPGEKREYTGSLPLSSGPNGNNNNRGNFGTTQNAITCYECGVQGHFMKDCPKLKNGNRGNQCGNGNAPAKPPSKMKDLSERTARTIHKYIIGPLPRLGSSGLVFTKMERISFRSEHRLPELNKLTVKNRVSSPKDSRFVDSTTTDPVFIQR